MVRTPCCDKSGLRKGTWTPEEDRKLKAYVTRYGCWNWRQLPKYAGLARCGKSCRLRWMNYLRPNIKRGNYTKEEEETIIRLHEALGNRWSAIAAELPGRTDNEVKNHWHTTLKKRIKHKPSATKEDQDPALKRGTSYKEKEEAKLNNSHLLINPPSPPLILESSIMSSISPLQPASSDQFSSITTDNTVASSKDPISDTDNNSNNNDNDDNNNKAFFEAYDYEVDSGNFWTEPFFSDSLLTDHMYQPMMMEAEFPFVDGEIFCPFGFYNHRLEGFNF